MRTANLCGASQNQYKGAAHGRQTRRARCLLIFLTLVISLISVVGNTSAATNVSGNITANKTWTLAGSPYIVTGSVWVYGNGTTAATLTIEPGVEVRFNAGTNLQLAYDYYGYKGALIARGTSGAPITFTSSAATPKPGDWQGIIFGNYTDDATTILENCIVEYGGSSGYANLHMTSASPTIKNSTIRYNSRYGIYLGGASSPIIGDDGAGNTITGNTTYGIYSDGNTSSRPTITNNTISNNGSYPLRIGASAMNNTIHDNTYTGNGKQLIEMIGQNINANTTWRNPGIPYNLTGSVWVYGNGTTAATLTIEPGVEVRFNAGTNLQLAYDYYGYKGALIARGTSGAPITFTSSAATPKPGDWQGIIFGNYTDDATTILENCIVEYGGSSGYANLHMTSASPTIKNSTIRYNSGYGIYLGGASSPIIGDDGAGNTITGNTTYGIYSDGNTSSRPTITNNTISNNGSYPLRIGASAMNNTIHDNTYTGNGKQLIEMIGQNINANTTWRNPGIPYNLTGSVWVYGNGTTAATLTIEPGVEVRFNAGTNLQLAYDYYGYKGALIARGTSGAPITFTSSAATPKPGDWQGIIFGNYTDDATTILENCIVEYGGSSGYANLHMTSASPTIKNSTIRYNSGYGIYLDTSSRPTITNNTISNNGSYPLRIGAVMMNNIDNNTYTGNGKQLIEMIGQNINANTTWRNPGIPYNLTGSVWVYGNGTTAATLTIEPGVEVRFNAGTNLQLAYDYYGYKGALIARGTSGAPITFTSSAATPKPGDWQGIIFGNYTDDATTILENCIVEYGGYNGYANLYIVNASPTIRYNTIRNSSNYGISLSGAGSNTAAITCNNLKDNVYGIYLTSAQTPIHNNNFLRNTNRGLYNASGSYVDATNNWWGDANGPNQTGDSIYGNVTFNPWLASPTDCVSIPPANSAPFNPRIPSPANNAVNVALTSGAVTLTWLGGDPNPQDTVVYDVYFGTAINELTKVADSVTTLSYSKTGLNNGITYYWKIVARDNGGLEAAGPVWSFTTAGPPPDLVVSGISFEPSANISGGQTVTFTATVQNNGTGPVVSSFYVDFRIDDASIGGQTVSQLMPIGGSVQVSRTWQAKVGNHTVSVVADSNNAITEADETNNILSQTLPNISDTNYPLLAWTSIANGSSVKQLTKIEFSLSDPNGGSIDTEFVKSSIVLRNSSDQTIAGTVSETAGRFTFVPSNLPLPDGAYTLLFTAKDMAGNTHDYSITFTVDTSIPSKPAITGASVTTGVIQVRPFDNRSNTSTVTITGTRENNTSVLINNYVRAGVGSGNWSVNLPLTQGANALEIWLADAAGNRSESEWVDIYVDSVAPAITSITPLSGSFLNVAPANVTVVYQEVTSGLNLANTIKSVKNSDNQEIPGAWTVVTGNQFVFTPATALADSTYTVALQLEDMLGNKAVASSYNFTVDTIPPPAPTVEPVTSPAHNPNQLVKGTKEAYASIWLNGQKIVDNTPETTWQYTVTLVTGQNTLVFFAKDRAGNQSAAGTTITVTYDDIAPIAVNTLTVNGNGTGTTATLNWTGYNEAGQGDIASYRIYVSASSFASITGLTPAATVNAGTFTYTVTGLTRNATYWFAVVAVDTMGNMTAAVTSLSAVILDKTPPEDVSNLQAQCFDTSLVFTWNHSANTGGDLKGYRVYFNNSTTAVELPSTQNTYEKTGLAVTTAYPFKITAYDNDNNESAGKTINGVTLLNNPANLTATPYSGYVNLTWTAVSPSQLVKLYRVYASLTPFTSVEGMAPRIATTTTAARVAGLDNNKAYYFAVTAVNLSDGERKTVNTVTSTPVPDSQGPEVSNIKINGVDFTSGATLRKSGTFTISVSDQSGISRVEYYIDGVLVKTAIGSYDFSINLYNLTDGSHALTIKAYDTFGNYSTSEYNFNVALNPPGAPVIAKPVNGLITNKAAIDVTGTAEKYCEVILIVNDAQTGSIAAVDANGNFTISFNLAPGQTRLRVAAQNRGGMGPVSAEKLVTLDTTVPSSPGFVAAQAQADGKIRLSWKAPADAADIAGYNIYRSNSSFTSVGGAEKVNSSLIKALLFDDLPAADGTYYYRLTTVSSAGNESGLSAEVSAVSDRVKPKALSIVYSPQGKYDSVTGRMGPGRVDVVLTVSKPLLAVPFLSITPDGGMPISVELNKTGDLEYKGFFTIANTTPTGTAYAVFSGRDAVGNRGTEIVQGQTIKIDTAGPAISRLTVQPKSPIKNDQQAPVTVSVVVGLNEKVKAGQTPQMSYELSGSGRQPVALTLAQVTPQESDVQAWVAYFTLPNDAGLAAPESFRFIYSASDDLDNVNNNISGENSYQVYQGNLPPLSAPSGLTAAQLPGGKIKLNWSAVVDSAGYQLYRKAPGESELALYQTLGPVTEYIDSPTVDGLYSYAIASIRMENSQQTASGISAPVEIASDSAVPQPPANLVLQLVSQGIYATWQPSPSTETVTYRLYRSTAEITSVEGLTPVIPSTSRPEAIDTKPSSSNRFYVVTAMDKAGNESAPSNCFYLNFGMLPVSGLKVRLEEATQPVISWTHPGGGGVVGYNIYLGAVKLNQSLLTGLSYTDTGYAGDERLYTVKPVDNNSVEGLGRSVTLPVLKAAMKEGSIIKRGVMNKMEFDVKNRSAANVDRIQLQVNVDGHGHTSDFFSVSGVSQAVAPVIIGGYSDLQASALVQFVLSIQPLSGEVVEIVRSANVEVGTGMLVLQVINDKFTRGGAGPVRFSLENTGDAEIEIVTAKSNGKAASNEITAYLLDKDENVLSSAQMKQSVGNNVITLSNGNTVARIAAGAVFTSDPVSLSVPANTPNDVTVRLTINKVYYHQGKVDQVVMDGISGNQQVTLIDTAYRGEIISVTPSNTTAGKDVTITGRAVENATGNPMPMVPLHLILTVKGFERTFDVMTSAEGTFTYIFNAKPSESGIYSVRAVHPDILDKTIQSQFVIGGLIIQPDLINLNIPKNYEQAINIKIKTGEGTPVNNLRLAYEIQDQLTGMFPPGVHVNTGTPVNSAGPSVSVTLPLSIWADNTASQSSVVILKVKSDDNGGTDWGTIRINCTFSASQPALFFTPNYLETGVKLPDSAGAPINSVTETITLQNKGTQDLEDVTVSLIYPDGTPAPNWVYLSGTGTSIGTIAVGQNRQIGITFSPPFSVPQAVYSFKLRVTSSNYPATDINIFASVTASGEGNVLFKVSNIYTGTLNANGQLIQGLAGATIRIENEKVVSIQRSGTTDSAGELLMQNLPAGIYKCRVTASNHEEYIGRFWIKPAITTTESVFLNYNLVTVEWEVRETTIQDQYEIVLKATYETNVPAAVVVFEPASVNLPKLKAGDVYHTEVSLTNYGLITAENVKINLPQNEFFKIEILQTVPSSINAMEKIVLTYRFTALKDFDQGSIASGSGGGGACSGVITSYTYKCSNGFVTTGSASQPIVASNCSGGGGGGGGGGTGIGGGGGGGGGGSSSGGGYGTLPAGGQCLPDPPRKPNENPPCTPPCPREKGDCPKPDSEPDPKNPCTGSGVGLLSREYSHAVMNLTVKVPNGTIEDRLIYLREKWQSNNTYDNLIFEKDALGIIKAISMRGAVYKRISSDVYTSGIYRINKQAEGWRWEDKQGGWELFDTYGRITSYGGRRGITAKYLYEAGENGKLIGLADRNDNQVIWYEYNAEGLVSAVRDGNSRRVEYTYTNKLLTAVKDVEGKTTGFTYNSSGQLLKITDPEGKATTINYDVSGYVKSVLDGTGKGYNFAWNYDASRAEYYGSYSTTDGKVREAWFDKEGTLKRVSLNGRTTEKYVKDGRDYIWIDEQGNETRKFYDEFENLLKVQHPDGSAQTYEYEHKFNQVVKEVNELGIVTTYQYDVSGNLIRRAEAVGTADERVTEYTYNSESKLTRERYLGNAVTPASEINMTYDGSGNMLTRTDAEGNNTTYTYDYMGNVLTSKDPTGKTWTNTYDKAGRLKTVTDPLSKTTTFYYDGVGNKTAEVDPQGKQRLYEYDARKRVTKITDHNGKETKFTYNVEGKLLQQTDADGKQVNYQYDADGRLVQTTDGNGNAITNEYNSAATGGCTTGCSGSGGGTAQPSKIVFPTFAREYKYDLRGRRTLEMDDLGVYEKPMTLYAYDAAGNLISKTDREGKVTTYAYDNLRRLKKVTDPLSQATEYSYDNRDNLIALKDAKGQTTAFAYDKNNRLIKETRPMGQETNYQYDDAGRLYKKTDSRGQTHVYSYDDTGRMTRIVQTDAVSGTKTINFTYDDAGNLLTYSDGTTSASYSYDSLYRKIAETTNYGTFSLTTGYSYNANGTKKIFTYPNNTAVEYSYDANNQITGVNIPNAGFVSFSTYKWTRPTSITLPGGGKREFNYDALMRTQAITSKDPGQNQIMGYNYAYDKMDNIKTRNTGAGNYAYNYDDLYRLNDVKKDTQSTEAYTYDPVGNRKTSNTSTDWTYNANNELLSLPGLTGQSSPTTYQYDANGNTTQKNSNGQIVNYIYNADNRLVEVKDGSNNTIAKYTYDPFGRRIKKTVSPAGGGQGVETYYLYSDEGLIGEYDSTGTEIKTYGYKPNSTWGTDPIFCHSREGGNPEFYFYHNDHLGTPQKMTNISGAIVWSATYDAFGKATVDATTTVTSNLRFPGQYYDQETNLHYNGHRYYDSSTGRYVTKDPIGLYGGFNLYTYVKNSPLKYIDPMGLYGGGVHYGDTYDACVRSGLPPLVCHEIASADENTDEKYDPIRGEDSCNNQKNYHFPTRDRIDELMKEALEKCSNEALGEALHAVQDYWSHVMQGYRYDWRCKGHAFASPDPDAISTAPDLHGQMLKEISDKLKEFKEKCKCPPK